MIMDYMRIVPIGSNNFVATFPGLNLFHARFPYHTDPRDYFYHNYGYYFQLPDYCKKVPFITVEDNQRAEILPSPEQEVMFFKHTDNKKRYTAHAVYSKKYEAPPELVVRVGRPDPNVMIDELIDLYIPDSFYLDMPNPAYDFTVLSKQTLAIRTDHKLYILINGKTKSSSPHSRYFNINTGATDAPPDASLYGHLTLPENTTWSIEAIIYTDEAHKFGNLATVFSLGRSIISDQRYRYHLQQMRRMTPGVDTATEFLRNSGTEENIYAFWDDSILISVVPEAFNHKRWNNNLSESDKKLQLWDKGKLHPLTLPVDGESGHSISVTHDLQTAFTLGYNQFVTIHSKTLTKDDDLRKFTCSDNNRKILVWHRHKGKWRPTQLNTDCLVFCKPCQDGTLITAHHPAGKPASRTLNFKLWHFVNEEWLNTNIQLENPEHISYSDIFELPGGMLAVTGTSTHSEGTLAEVLTCNDKGEVTRKTRVYFEDHQGRPVHPLQVVPLASNYLVTKNDTGIGIWSILWQHMTGDSQQ